MIQQQVERDNLEFYVKKLNIESILLNTGHRELMRLFKNVRIVRMKLFMLKS